jgi:hypothetical protein
MKKVDCLVGQIINICWIKSFKAQSLLCYFILICVVLLLQYCRNIVENIGAVIVLIFD